MELENEVRIAWSPNARVVLGCPGVTLLAAVAIGALLGLLGATLLRRRHRARTRSGGRSPLPPLRMPDDAPDVQTEL